MLPRELIESGLDAGCVRLMAYVLLKAGPDNSWPITGATEIGDRIGMQAATLLSHAKHLRDAGLITFERLGREKYRFTILHDPKRGLLNSGVAIPPSRPHARKKSKYSAPPILRSPAASDPSFSAVGGGNDQTLPIRPAKNRGQGEPRTCEPRTEADAFVSDEDWEDALGLRDWRDRSDSEIGLFPSDGEEPDELLADAPETEPFVQPSRVAEVIDRPSLPADVCPDCGGRSSSAATLFQDDPHRLPSCSCPFDEAHP
jgi:DNA-binding transcriptional ArsR family regulator